MVVVFVNPYMPFCISIAYHWLQGYFHNWNGVALATQELSFLELEELLLFHTVICLPDCCLDLWSFLSLIPQLKTRWWGHDLSFNQDGDLTLIYLTLIYTVPLRLIIGGVTWTRTGSLTVFNCATVARLNSQNSYLITLYH